MAEHRVSAPARAEQSCQGCSCTDTPILTLGSSRILVGLFKASALSFLLVLCKGQRNGTTTDCRDTGVPKIDATKPNMQAPEDHP